MLFLPVLQGSPISAAVDWATSAGSPQPHLRYFHEF
jgi:hypothetical protein